MVRGAYADAMAIRVLRLLDADSAGLSLRHVLAQIAGYPQLLHDKVGDREFANVLPRSIVRPPTSKLSWTRIFPITKRTPSAKASTHRALDEAIDTMISTLKTYYWVVTDGHLDLQVTYAEDPLAIFRFAWIEVE